MSVVGIRPRYRRSGPARAEARGAEASSATATCRHCGNSFHPVEERTEYCCTGCEYVHRLITGQKLDRFYELRRGSSAPVRSVVFQSRDLRWLEGLIRQAENPAVGSSGEVSLDLDLQGISCVGCVWLIDRLFRDTAGSRGLHVNATVGRLRLRWSRGTCDVVGFARELQRFGYIVGPATKAARSESGALVLRLGLCAAFAMNGMLFSLPPYLGMQPDFPFAKLFSVLSFVFATLSVAVGGTYFIARAWRSLRLGVLHIDLPIALGILVGYAGSIYAWTQAHGGFVYFDFVTTFTFLMIVGRWTQLAAVERNRNHLLGLRQDLPEVELLEDEHAVADGVRPDEREPEAGRRVHRPVASKPATAIVRSDRFRVDPGQVVPVSSTLLGPAGSMGMDWINGESEARTVLPGQVVESGAINLSPHPIRFEALEAWNTSLLARLMAVPTPAEWRNRGLEQIIRIYLFAVLLVAALGGAFWLWRTGDVVTSVQVVVSVLVVSCPCATGVTLPLIDELAVARLRHAGVFVRSETLWARLNRVRKVIFDKTGTLTLESLTLRNPEAMNALDSEAIGALWRLVQAARHPVASCIREALLARGLASVRTPTDAVGVREEVGLGLEWTDDRGCNWRLGRGRWIDANASPAGDVAFGCGGRIYSWFHVAEEVREDAVEEVSRLQDLGRNVFILSGDQPAKVAAMAARLGLEASAAQAAKTPQGKADWVRALDVGGDTLMIGDGANDSLAFEVAACRGTPAIERGLLEHRSDFFFLGRGLSGIRRLLEAAGTRRSSIRHVLAFTICYNIVVVAMALAGRMNPLLAAVLMPASAVVSLGIATWRMRRV